MNRNLLVRPLGIGTLSLPNNLALAPMAGTSDLAFRRICHRMGAGLTVTELVSARGMMHDPAMRRNWRYLAIDADAGAMGIQLFGADPDDFAAAIWKILDHPILGHCSLIDINMGCPVRKVVSEGAGCALMQTPQLAARIAQKAVAAAQGLKPVTVKCRSGWDDASVNAVLFARMLADCGVSAITVHARTRAQMYGGKADWSVLAAVKAAVSLPVYGNGDVTCWQDVDRMLRETGVDGVMIGRAAQGNPWLFRQIHRQDGTGPGPEERRDIILEHLAQLAELLGEATAVREMRCHLGQYLRGTPGAARLRAAAMAVTRREDLENLLGEWQIRCQESCENS
ncbi:MAG: tRNA dihydrouridine synthase DusB [Clostridiales bacterium]|nr:tRNA dihydrouridine synthase DusB [Clostridiales bacterium]